MSEPTIPIGRCILYAEDFADPDMKYTPSEPVRRAILAHLRRLQALEGALKRIEGGHIPGASDMASEGRWQDFAIALQVIARQALASQGETPDIDEGFVQSLERGDHLTPDFLADAFTSPAQWPSDEQVETARTAFYPVFMASIRIGNGEVNFTIVPALRAALLSLRPPPTATASIAPKGGDDLAEWIAESAILQTAEEAYDAVVPQDWDWGCYQPALLAALVAVYPLIEARSPPPADERVKGLVSALEACAAEEMTGPKGISIYTQAANELPRRQKIAAAALASYRASDRQGD